MTEVWKPVVGFEGAYEVSDLGRVRSLDRVTVGGNRWGTTSAQHLRGHVLRPKRAGKGYVAVCLHLGQSERQYRYVHHLVLEAFVGPRPAGMDGCHNRGNKADNRLSELRWDAPDENQRDRVAHGNDQFGERNTQAVLTTTDVVEILKRRSTPDILAFEYGVSERHIKRIQRGERWRHVA